MLQGGICDGVSTIIREAGVVDSNVLITIRHVPLGHPQILYRQAHYLAVEANRLKYQAEFDWLTQITAGYEGVLHQELHKSPLDARVSIRCFGCKSRELPAIQHGTIILGVLALDGIQRPKIYDDLRSESREVQLVRALYV